MKRRRMLTGLGTLVFGASGFMASGAADIGNIGSSGGEGWVRLDEPDIVDPDAPSDDDDPDRPTGEVRVQLVTDPAGGGSNRVGRLSAAPRTVRSNNLRSEENGFLDGLNLSDLSPGAVTTVGRINDDIATEPVGFLVANVGGVGQGGRRGQAVTIRLDLVSADGTVVETDAIRFAWRIDDQRRGTDMLGSTIELAPREVIGVTIVADGRENTGAVDAIDRMRVTVDRARGPDD